MPQAGFEPAIAASERPQNQALESVAWTFTNTSQQKTVSRGPEHWSSGWLTLERVSPQSRLAVIWLRREVSDPNSCLDTCLDTDGQTQL
jgi:hypothetical protein